jgi:hypothetical protein
MDMLEVHAEASQSSNVAYNDFLTYYKHGKPMVFGFVEGKQDPSYYRSFVEAVLPEGWECKLFQSGNKKRVLEVFEGMDWNRFHRASVCFFVDRDLSTFLGGETHEGSNLYVSDNYSIENDLVNVRTLERIMEEVKGVSGLSPVETEKLRALFHSNLACFIEALACVMAQIVILRRNEAKGDNLIARLDKIKPHQFFEFVDGALVLKAEFSSPESRSAHVYEAVIAPAATHEESAMVEAGFRAEDGPAKFTRGKYLLRFFIDCSEALRTAIPALFPRFNVAPGTPGGLGYSDGVKIVGPRCRCPKSLRDFLERNFLAHITHAGNAI